MPPADADNPNSSPELPPIARNGWFGLSPGATGMILCGLSALFYSMAQICIRQLSEMPQDQTMIVAVKETFTAVVVLPLVILHMLRGKRLAPTWRLIGLLVFVALMVQIVGNLNQIWAFGHIGLTVAVPTIFTAMLITGAVFGRIFLGEIISHRSVVAMVLLIGAITLLSIAKGEGEERTPTPAIASAQTDLAQTDLMVAPSGEEPIPWIVVQAVIACIVTGITYASLAITIRHTTHSGVPIVVIMIITTGVGTVSLSAMSLWNEGPGVLARFSADTWSWVLAAGAFNFFGFISLITGLALTKIVRANVLNASQVAITSLAGVLFFKEAAQLSAGSTGMLLLGVLLTIIGVALIGSPDKDEVENETHRHAEQLPAEPL